jgi:dTDP-4-dehydrorhamnose 3,5-epimerase
MKFTPLTLSGAFIIEPDVHTDERGAFYRYFCKEEFREIGHSAEWVQLNQSYTARTGTIRGMHYQLPPHSEIKLVRCISGKVFDVIVDIRKQSPTFLKWVGTELSAANRKMLYIPEGFAHGFQTLDDNSELIYHHSVYYARGFEGAIRFDDPLIDILWPLPVRSLSERDRNHPLLNAGFTGI